MAYKARARPTIEAVTWDGTNDAEVADLATRVLGVSVITSVTEPDEEVAWNNKRETAIRAGVEFLDERPAVGLHLMVDGVTQYRIEQGEVLVYDPWRGLGQPSLFVLLADAFEAFYEAN